MTDLRLTALAASLPASVPFTGPEALERRRGRPFAARLGANESAFGPSPGAREALERAARDAWMYGDPEVHALRHAIAAHHNVEPAQVVAGEGIDGLLGSLVRLTVAEGTPVVASRGSYPTFAFHVAASGGRLLTVPYRGDGADLDALGGLVRQAGARLLYLANPDNPMGSMQGGAAVEALAASLPPSCLLVLDEAYAEFAPSGSLPRIDAGDPAVLRLRTFSKAHGLAGLRVGYAIGPAPLLAAFDRVRNHFGLGSLAQAGALAAIRDEGWPEEVARRVARARDRIGAVAEENGLRPLPSHANFVAVDCGGDGARARAILDALLARGVFVRMPGVAPLDRCIRVTAGPDEALDAFATALPEALAEAREHGVVTGLHARHEHLRSIAP